MFKYTPQNETLKRMRENHLKALVFLLSAVIATSGITTITASDRTVWTTIMEAYYSDLDGDGLSDDVFLGVQVDFLNFGESDFENGIEYTVLIGLVLPSGRDFWYQMTDMDSRATVYLSFHLLNHAVENGWYESYAAGAHKEMRLDKPVLAHYVIFDPPGGQNGGIPTVEAFKN